VPKDLSIEKIAYTLFGNVLLELPESYEKLAAVGCDRFSNTPEVAVVFKNFSSLALKATGDSRNKIISAAEQMSKSSNESEELLGKVLLKAFLTN
jgi:hypothetical protein